LAARTWLAIYREYWKGLVKDRLAGHLRMTRSRELQESFLSFFKGIKLKALKHAKAEDGYEGVPIRKADALSLAFLRTYHAVVFTRDAAAVLNTILINGQFYNRDSHFDYFSTYNELDTLGETVDQFEYLISPMGDFGIRYAAAQKEVGSLTLRRRRVQSVINEVHGEAGQIIWRGKEVLAAMIDLLNGIMKGETGNSYGALINFYRLADKGGAFMENISAAAGHARTALKLLEDIEHLEMEKDETALPVCLIAR
jgi:hypothetical protein